jgi:hypothetical protein
LLKRVLHRDNGDVLVQQIPMVDQGPKGFCVPATWERYLRYLEMPADMYVLAMAGGTAMGGGTSTYVIRSQVESYVRQYERQIQVVDPSIETKNLAKYIDKGLPLMWACFVIEPIEKEFSKRTKERRTVTDWAAYEKSLESVRTAMKGKNFVDTAAGHVRMIIGYNPKTREVAISDSWGVWAAERWLTYEEAAAISQGELTLIRW